MTTGPERHVRTRRWLVRAGLLLLAWALVHLAAITADGLSDEDVPADVIVVLGNHVSPEGVPARRLVLRLERALAAYRAGLAPTIIVSGGQDPGSPHEATVMRDWLIARGVPEGHVVEDRSGINTRKTAEFVAAWLSAHDETSAIAVSQYYHVSRCRLALARAGVAATGAHADLELEAREPWSLLRELVGYYAYLLDLK